MRNIILFVLLTLSLKAYGQSDKWQLSFLIQPEMTFHKDSYRWWKENADKTTYNLGAATTVQYNISKSFFVNAGVGFISRTLRTANHLNQAGLPPPKQSFTQELVTTESVSYRVLSFPVNVGYNFLHNNKFNSFVTTGIAGNYLINTYYKSNFSRYDGAYKKNYWQGYSLNLGIGTDYKITKQIFVTTALAYAIVNEVRGDDYILDVNSNNLTLKHNFISLHIGIKLSLPDKTTL